MIRHWGIRTSSAWLLAAVAFTLSGSPAFATYPGANGRIAFEGIMPGCDSYAICTIRPDGTGLQQLTSGSYDGAPAWSAHGKRIAFTHSGALYTMSANGGNQTRVAYYGLQPYFSPHGTRIVYIRDGSILSIRTDGSDRRLILKAAYAERPIYSPDGRWIAFDRSVDQRGGRIWKVRPDGSGQRPLTAPPPGQWDQVLDWSPDGARIVFVRCKVRYSWHVSCADFSIRPDGSNERQVVAGDVYAPSGDRFADVKSEVDFTAGVDECSDIYTFAVGGGDGRLLTHNCDDFLAGGPDGFAYQPSWQPLPKGLRSRAGRYQR